AAPRLRVLATMMACASLVACGGDASDLDVEVSEIDQESSVAVTDEELASFQAPRDSVLDDSQVVAHLRTSLLQFDLIREESARLRDEVQAIEDRSSGGGALSQLQN